MYVCIYIYIYTYIHTYNDIYVVSAGTTSWTSSRSRHSPCARSSLCRRSMHTCSNIVSNDMWFNVIVLYGHVYIIHIYIYIYYNIVYKCRTLIPLHFNVEINIRYSLQALRCLSSTSNLASADRCELSRLSQDIPHYIYIYIYIDICRYKYVCIV